MSTREDILLGLRSEAGPIGSGTSEEPGSVTSINQQVRALLTKRARLIGSGKCAVAEVGERDRGRRGPLDRGAVHVPGVAGGGKCRPTGGECVALHNIELANSGVSRTVVVHQAEWVLATEERRADADCVWPAVLALLYADQLGSARVHCAQVVDEEAWRDSARHQELITLMHSRISALSGDAARAVELLGALLMRRPSPRMTGLVVAWLVEALVHMGEFERAHVVLVEHDMVGEIGDASPDAAHVLGARGALHSATGRFRESVADYIGCGRVLSAQHVANPAVVPWRSRATFGALASGRRDLARSLAEAELTDARKWGSPRAIGVALHALAATQREELAAASLDEAVELLRLTDARVELMRALCDTAAMHGKRDEPGGARSRLRAAGVLARECRNPLWSRWIDAELGKMNSAGGAPALTKQEIKIAHLAQTGYTNRQIAEMLHLTVRTVEFHLSGVYRKLGVRGRRQLTKSLSARGV